MSNRVARRPIYPLRCRSHPVSSPLHVTAPLLSVLLEIAADAEPDPANVHLIATPAGDLDPLSESAPDSEPLREGSNTKRRPLADLDPSTPVYSDFYFPEVGNSLHFVFGVDLGTPAGQSRGRFLSHPDGNPDVTMRDDLAATMLVAVPPWKPANVAAYDRDSTDRDLVIVDGKTPEQDFDG